MKNNELQKGEKEYLQAKKYYEAGKLILAAKLIEAAGLRAPHEPVVHNLRGAIALARNDIATSIDAFATALTLDDSNWSFYANYGSALNAAGLHDDAIVAYQRALTCHLPAAEAAKIHFIISGALDRLGATDRAAEHLRQALALDADLSIAESKLIHFRQHLCDWSRYQEDRDRLRTLINGQKEVFPFAALAMDLEEAEHLKGAQNWAKSYNKKNLFVHRVKNQSRKINIGYLSSDFYAHATTYLIAEVIRIHDRSAFSIYGYCNNADDGSAHYRRIAGYFDKFTDICRVSDEEAAEMIFNDGIDILIDLKGYTRNSRPGIMARRPAPIQVNFLGYPGTMGAGFIDYIIGDSIVTPPVQQEFYREAIANLPHCYQPNDRQRGIAATPSRHSAGLPDDGFVFCCFNSPFKISPAFFDLWMTILAAVDNSVLWLIGSSAQTVANLRGEAQSRGIDPNRLVFAPTKPLPEHLARLRLADIVLDTLPYGAHTTGSDALWVGVPLVTCRGNSFAGRVGASLLTAMGVPELITESMEEYRSLIIELAQNPERLQDCRNKIARNRDTAPLFDTSRFVAHLEKGYKKMYDIFRSGKKPRGFTVEDDIND